MSTAPYAMTCHAIDGHPAGAEASRRRVRCGFSRATGHLTLYATYATLPPPPPMMMMMMPCRLCH